MGQLSFKGSTSYAASECSEEICFATERHRRRLFNSVRLMTWDKSPKVEKIRLSSIEGLLDEKRELPGDFLHEMYKWALECKSWFESYAIFIFLHRNFFFPFSCLSGFARHALGLRFQQSESRVEEDHRRHQHILLDGGGGRTSPARLAVLQNENVQRLHRRAGQFPRVIYINQLWICEWN